MEVSRLDELEREEILAEPEVEDMPAQETEEEVPVEEEVPEEEPVPEEELAAQEEPPAEKAEKPIKGPRAWPWLVAVLMMLLGLLLLVPAIWNMALAMPAIGGLVNEAAGKYESAMNAYEYLYKTDTTAQGWGMAELGLTSGTFPVERQFAIWEKLYGPLFIVQETDAYNLSEIFPEGVPKSLRKLADRLETLMDMIDGISAQLQEQPAEDENRGAWLLAGIEAARAQDEQAAARKLYYDAVILSMTANDPEQKQDNLARIAALQADPAGEFWMYEQAALYFAREDADYAALIAICDVRLKRSREDTQSMLYKIKALFLSGEEAKAFEAADACAKRPACAATARVAKAELYYRQGKYEQAIEQCDAVLAKADFTAPSATSAQATALRGAMEAACAKAAVLLMQDKPAEALVLLQSAADNPDGSMTVNLAYSQLAAYAAAGELEGEQAQNLVMMMLYSGYEIPQAITDLQEGKTTAKAIFTEGWGGFDA